MLVAACFSMPQAVVPFKLNFKSFIISIFVFIAVVRLVFLILDALIRHPSWWKQAACMPIVQLGKLAHRLVAAVLYKWTALRRGNKGPETASDVEMSPLPG